MEEENLKTAVCLHCFTFNLADQIITKQGIGYCKNCYVFLLNNLYLCPLWTSTSISLPVQSALEESPDAT